MTNNNDDFSKPFTNPRWHEPLIGRTVGKWRELTPEEVEESKKRKERIKKFIDSLNLASEEDFNKIFYYALDYILVLPFKPRDPDYPKDEPYLIIFPECPEDIRKRLDKDWPEYVKKEKLRKQQGKKRLDEVEL